MFKVLHTDKKQKHKNKQKGSQSKKPSKPLTWVKKQDRTIKSKINYSKTNELVKSKNNKSIQLLNQNQFRGSNSNNILR